MNQVFLLVNNSSNLTSLERAIKRFKRLLSCSLAAAVIWMGTSATSMLSAQASPTQISPQLMTVSSIENAIEEIDEKVKSELDTVAGSGTSDRLEGQVDRAAGKAKQNLGEVTGQTEGALQQARGKAKEDIGTTKGAIDDAADEVEESANGFFSGVKNLFN